MRQIHRFIGRTCNHANGKSVIERGRGKMSFESIFVAGCTISVFVFYTLWLYLSKKTEQLSQPRSQAAFDACNHRHVSTKINNEYDGVIGVCKNCFWPMQWCRSRSIWRDMEWIPMDWEMGWGKIRNESFLASCFASSPKSEAVWKARIEFIDKVIEEGQSTFLKENHY